ncbi:MAG TPA: GDSL-type esterase/lipase family protein [Xanthobacteraceae bacterium]|jgi:lysophospholipase L1-like esterase
MNKTVLATALAAGLYASTAFGQDRPSCGIPPYLLFSDSQLKRVSATVTATHKLTIAVVGTGSSALAGPDGPSSAYPARLEAVLSQRLPGIPVKVVTLLRTRETAEDLARGMNKMMQDEKPNLVLWQTGTIDAIRRIDPDNFQSALQDGVRRLRRGGADVILMNMQYSPRTEEMISVAPYADIMRVVAQEQDVPLLDRLEIMRHWSDVGAFDLHATGKDNVLARRVHDCIGRAIALLIINSGHLENFERKAGE